jgi:hypothetical protein
VKTLAVLLAIPTLLLGWLQLRDRGIESSLEPVASAIAGHDVDVECQGLLGSLVDVQARHGEVRFDAAGRPEPRIFLTHTTCSRLRSFAAGRRGELDCLAELDWARSTPLVPGDRCYRRASPTVYALLVLAHEAYHTAGSTNEAATNCYAIQAMAFAATELGARVPEALLVARAMTALEPLQDGGYGTADCAPGTPLDLNPETDSFPTELPIAAPTPRSFS